MEERTCSMSECKNAHKARGLCKTHYYRLRAYGSPSTKVRAKRVWPTDAVRAGECLVWPYNIDSSGYGTVYVDGKKKLAHRHAWEQACGAIPHGMLVDHKCHNRRCIEISHLRLATRSQNNANRRGATVESQTGARNVYINDRGFYVAIRNDKVLKYYGTYPTLAEASEVAESMRKKLFGQFAGGA